MKTKRKIFDGAYTLAQTHKTVKPILVTSGCSFTDSSASTDHACSWPAYLRERCRFQQVIDVSHTGAGNEYIAVSLLNQLESMSKNELANTLVLVCWSGMDRKESATFDPSLKNLGGYVDDIQFVRPYRYSTDPVPEDVAKAEALLSWKNMVLTENYLQNHKIAYGFSTYVNMFTEPYLPRRDLAKVFDQRLDTPKLQRLKSAAWLHSHNDSLYEFCFYNNLLSDDLFHPSLDGYLNWTDNVLIPALVKKQVVYELQSS